MKQRNFYSTLRDKEDINMSNSKKVVQIKCVTRCPKCGDEKGICSAFEHTGELFPEISYKEFVDMAENDYDKFEQLVKDNGKFECQCGEYSDIIEILDMQWIDNLF